MLVHADGEWARAVDGYPSTHLLKPASREQPTMIYDEEYGSRLVRALGLAEFRTSIQELDDVPALVIDRYDRRHAHHGIPERAHQEDISQVLGLRGDEKYQRYRHAAVTRSHLAAEIGSWGMPDADGPMGRTLHEILDVTKRETPQTRHGATVAR